MNGEYRADVPRGFVRALRISVLLAAVLLVVSLRVGDVVEQVLRFVWLVGAVLALVLLRRSRTVIG